MNNINYDKPPVSEKDMDSIERRHEVAEDDYKFFSDNTWAVSAHADRGMLLQQLDYTAAVIIDLQLKLAGLREEKE